MTRFLCWLRFSHFPRSRLCHRMGKHLCFTYWACRRCGAEWTQVELMGWKK